MRFEMELVVLGLAVLLRKSSVARLVADCRNMLSM
jgi:hypothetical protein